MSYDNGGLSEWESRDLDYRNQQNREEYKDKKIKSLELEIEKLKQKNKKMIDEIEVLNAHIITLNRKLNYKNPEEIMRSFFK